MRKLLAYAAIYFLWGASFLAIRQVVAVTPPFFAASFRFLCAGGILYAYSRWQGMPQPDRRQWIEHRCAWPGHVCRRLRLPFLGGEGSAFGPGGRDCRHHSSLGPARRVVVCRFATADGESPGRHRPGDRGRRSCSCFPQDFTAAASAISALVLLFGCFLWAGGTVASRHLQLPRQLSMSSGLQMAWGGGFLLLLSAATGELGTLAGSRPSLELAACVRHGLSHPVRLDHCVSPPMSGSSRGIRPPALPAMPMSTR